MLTVRMKLLQMITSQVYFLHLSFVAYINCLYYKAVIYATEEDLEGWNQEYLSC